MRHVLPLLASLIYAATTLGAPVIDQSHIITSSTGGIIIYAGDSPAQTFTVGASGLLSQVDVLLRRDTADIGTLALELWPIVGGGPAGSTPLFSTPINTSAVTTGSTATYVPIDVTAGGLYVSPGDQFAIAVSGTASLSGAHASWTGGFPGYTAGGKFDRFGAWETDGADFDYGFRTWVDSAATPPGLTTLALTPSSEWDASLSTSGGSVISTAGDTMRVDRAPTVNQDHRGLIEFDASALPARAKLRTAKLTFDINQFSQSGPIVPRVAAYGYQADGTPADADARNLTQLLGQSAGIQTFDRVNMPLDVQKVSTMLQASPNVGVVAYEAIANVGVNIVASQLAHDFPTSYVAPTLSLGYSIPSYPAQSWPPGDYNHDANIDAADYPIWRKAKGTTGPSPADGDGNGVVDQADYNLWRAAVGKRPDDHVNNGDFQSGSLSGWNVIIGPNTNVTFGFPRVESFDVDGDGLATNAMRVRLGRTDTTQFGGTVALEQQMLLAAGDYNFSANVASQSQETTGNTGPGNYELAFDGKIVDQVLLNGTLIDSMAVIRDSLQASLLNVEAGYHTLRLAVSRGAVNSRAIYQFIDDIQLNRVAPPSTPAVPEPTASALSIVALALAARSRMGCPPRGNPSRRNL
jgi:hypothetical protein